MPKSKKVIDNTPQYIEADEQDKQVFVLKEAFTFGIDERDTNPSFPYVISLSLKNDLITLNSLKALKKKY